MSRRPHAVLADAEHAIRSGEEEESEAEKDVQEQRRKSPTLASLDLQFMLRQEPGLTNLGVLPPSRLPNPMQLPWPSRLFLSFFSARPQNTKRTRKPRTDWNRGD